VTPVLEKPYISVSINPENIIFWHFSNGGHTRKSIMAAPMFLRMKRSIGRTRWNYIFFSRWRRMFTFLTGYNRIIHRQAITIRFTLQWSDKLKHEWKHLNNVLTTNVDYSLLKEIKYCLYYILVVYLIGKQTRCKHIYIIITFHLTDPSFSLILLHISQ
jgi:hypothetical protein